MTTNCQGIYANRAAAKKAKATLGFLTRRMYRMKEATIVLFSALSKHPWGPGIRTWDRTVQRILTKKHGHKGAARITKGSRNQIT